MSIDLDPIDLSAAVVGFTSKVDWTGKIQQSGSVGLRPGRAHIRLFNESGAGLRFKWGTGQAGDRIPAGAWPVFEIPAGVTTLNFTVENLLLNAPVSQLGPTVYEPGETVPETPNLGNSPIGLSQAVSALSTKIPINTTSGRQVAIEFGPDVATGSDWEFAVEQSTGFLVLLDAVHNRVIWRATEAMIGDTFHILQACMLEGVVGQVGSVPTDGALGVAPVAKVPLSIAVTTTAGANIVVFAVPGTGKGLYRVSAYLRLNNSVSGQLISLTVNWTDPDTGTAHGAFLVTGAVRLDGTTSVVNGGYPINTVSVLAKGGTNIVIGYTDPGGTPADFVSIGIEQVG